MSSNTLNPVELTQRLIRCDTVSGGDERRALELLAEPLEAAGFNIEFDAYDPEHPCRCSLLARLRPCAGEPALCLCGHIDTVPPGTASWRHSPMAAHIVDGRLYGRGSCDMKSGVAAMVCAAAHMAGKARAGGGDLAVHIYGGEETGCEGSFHVAAQARHLHGVAAVIVGEPTSCLPLCGHKGALWLRCTAKGVAAHASMPEQGDNALGKIIIFANRLLEFNPQGEHPVLGGSSCVLSTLHAGGNINSVPDSAVLTIDIRSVPGQDHTHLRRVIENMAGPAISLATMLDIPPVWTSADHPWFAGALAILEASLGKKPGIAGVQFFTDAAALRPALPDTPMLILGPGDPALAHQTDENCPISQISLASDMYTALIADWFTRGERHVRS